jgi:AAA15 family ATPase/GTPase
MYYVHPSVDELFYLRVLLMIVKGARIYVDIRTFNNRIYNTFRKACDTRGLLESNNEWNILYDEAVVSVFSYQLRELFVMVVLHRSVSNCMLCLTSIESILLTIYNIQFAMRLETHIMLSRVNNFYHCSYKNLQPPLLIAEVT